MIRVLLVEDDNLVRKSLISSFNWGAFDMEVVGEAKHGEKALEFLENHEVDLIITDLAMPIMPGTELIRRVKKRYPSVHVVVLSLHRDFEYIQEVMRLGAIDYIAKVELDNANMDKTLQRIHDRIKDDLTAVSSPRLQELTEVSKGYFLMTQHDIDKYERTLNQLGVTDNFHMIGLNVLYLGDQLSSHDIENQLSSLVSPHELVLLISFESDFPMSKKELEVFFSKYKDSIMFYESEKRGVISNFSLYYRDFFALKSSKEDIQKQKDQLISLNWCHSEEFLTQTMYDLRALRLSKSKLFELLLLTMHECKRIYADILDIDIHLPDEFVTWLELEGWFRETKEKIKNKLFRSTLSVETTASILMAIQVIEKKLNTPITANEISKEVNMSRSYFSICFKQVVGNTFNEYVRIARMRKAKSYLVNTAEKVSVIAEKVGYVDVKYFSKVFKQSTGFLPSEYRRKEEKG